LYDQPRLVSAIRVKVVANAHLGRLAEARAELSRMLALYPGLTVANYRPMTSSEVAELFIAGLRLAGLPEE